MINHCLSGIDFEYSILLPNTIHSCTIPCQKSCKTCKYINVHNYITSAVTSQNYTVSENRDEKWNCKTENLVYLITCKKCKIQYVGETERMLSTRFCEHRRNATKSTTQNVLLYKHFQTNNHSADHMSIEILQVIPKSGNRNIDKKRRRNAEDFWIKQLNCAYPLGLNTRITKFGNLSDPGDVINKTTQINNPYFQGLKLKRLRIINKNRKHTNNKLRNKIDYNKIATLLQQWEMTDRADLYRHMKQMNNKTLNQLLHESSTQSNLQELYAITTAISRHRNKQQKIKNNKISVCRIPIQHLHQCISQLKINKLLSDQNISQILNCDIKIPWENQISYKTSSPAWTAICNYGSFLNKLDNTQLYNTLTQDCKCNPTFRNISLKHVITGNLDIIENNTLRKYMMLGTKFKENILTTKSDICKSTMNDINNYIKKLLTKQIISEHQAKLLERGIETQLTKRLNYTFSTPKHHPPVTITKIRQELSKVHRDYIITPTDKIPGNYSIICKKFYTESLAKECGVTIVNNQITVKGNNNYIIEQQKSLNNIISIHTKLKHLHNVLNDCNNQTLPKIFATAKMHKNPPAFRTIVAAKKSSTKGLEKLCQKILKHYTRHFENYCKAALACTGDQLFTPISNSFSLVSKLRQIGTINYIYSGDFNALYPSLNHITILQGIYNIIDLCHKNAAKDFLTENGNFFTYREFKVDNKTRHKSEVKQLCQDILNTSYMRFASFIFKTIKGTPQGLSCSCEMANLALCWFEYKYLKNNKLKKTSEYFVTSTISLQLT